MENRKPPHPYPPKIPSAFYFFEKKKNHLTMQLFQKQTSESTAVQHSSIYRNKKLLLKNHPPRTPQVSTPPVSKIAREEAKSYLGNYSYKKQANNNSLATTAVRKQAEKNSMPTLFLYRKVQQWQVFGQLEKISHSVLCWYFCSHKHTFMGIFHTLQALVQFHVLNVSLGFSTAGGHEDLQLNCYCSQFAFL